MIGQLRLQEKLNNLTLNTFPHSLILAGAAGCGKHTYLAEVANKLGLYTVDISDKLKQTDSSGHILHTELLITQTAIPTLYIIDTNCLKNANLSFDRLLKVLEDISDFSYICILCESTIGIKPTILNRCQVWEFDSYTIEELSNFTTLTKEQLYNIYEIYDTPGKLLNNLPDFNTFNAYCQMAKQILVMIDRAIISNVLILPDKLSYKLEDNSKLYFNIFVNILKKTAYSCYYNHEINLDAVKLVDNLAADIKIFNIDKKKLYEKFLIELKDELKRFKG